MSNYINDLNSLIDTKREIKNIIIDTLDENPSEVFSYYPSYLRTIAAGYGGTPMDEDEVNAYISAYLSTYNYIDQDSLSSNSYVTSSQLPDLSSYVTYSFLSSQSYLTSIPAEYITQQELSSNSYLTQHQDLSSYVSKTELSNAGYISSIPSEYITESELSACGYITTIPSEYVTQQELSSNSYLTQHQDLSSYVSKTELSGMSYVTSTALENASYATQSYVTDKISAIPSVDLSSYATQSYVASYTNDNFLPLSGGTLSGDLIVNGKSYAYSFNLSEKNGWENINNWQTRFRLDGSIKYYLTSNRFYPGSNESASLGLSSQRFSDTYTKNIYTDNLYLNGTNIGYYLSSMFSYNTSTGVLTITTV